MKYDYIGKRFGKLVVLRKSEKTNKKKELFLVCKCDCGNETVVRAYGLKAGKPKSCGCLLHSAFKDITGNKYGRLTVIGLEGKNDKGVYMWRCKCDCGNEIVRDSCRLVTGNTKSCGCLKKELELGGLYEHKLHSIWKSMLGRCYTKTNTSYRNYGGRGIGVCNEWRKSFKEFYEWAYANGYRENLSIDRIDVNGNYEPENCRWVDVYTQANNRRNNRFFEYQREVHTAAEWDRKLGNGDRMIARRLCEGWSFEDALSIPKFKQRKRVGDTD